MSWKDDESPKDRLEESLQQMQLMREGKLKKTSWYELYKKSDPEIIPFEGYEYIVIQKDVCGDRPTIKGTRLEPWHLVSYGTIEDCLSEKGWNYLKREQVEEAFRFYEQNPELAKPDWEEFIGLAGWD